MYMVIEICDRTAVQGIAAETRGDASRIANNLLKEHCGIVGMPELYEAYAGPTPPGDWPPEMHLDAPEDAEMGAWANIKDMRWDAHIMYVPDDTAAAMLAMLLKVLCEAEKVRPGGRCQYSECSDCTITEAQEMLKAALGKIETNKTKNGGESHDGKQNGE